MQRYVILYKGIAFNCVEVIANIFNNGFKINVPISANITVGKITHKIVFKILKLNKILINRNITI